MTLVQGEWILKRIVLISCVSKKLPHPARAKDLYVSPLFRLNLQYARKLQPDAIYILSDGRFTDRGRTLRYLQLNNRLDNPIFGKGPKVVVHTVGFHGRDGEETLQTIAKSYGGTYRFVPGPMGEKDKKAMKMAKK